MRLRTMLVVASLFAFAVTAAPGVEARPDAVGGCSSGATVEVCSVPCLQPPCPQYVCVNSAFERICTDG